jgi:hypothetical protein
MSVLTRSTRRHIPEGGILTTISAPSMLWNNVKQKLLEGPFVHEWKLIISEITTTAALVAFVTGTQDMLTLQVPYFSIDNARIIYTNKSKFVKN